MFRLLQGIVQSIASVAMSLFALPFGQRQTGAGGTSASRPQRRLFTIRYIMILRCSLLRLFAAADLVSVRRERAGSSTPSES